MPRPKKKKIDINHDSVVSLLQEIYNECVEQRNTAIRIQNKMISYMKESTDMTLIGPVLKEQQKIIDSSIDKKLQLSKLLATIASKNMEVSGTGFTIDGDMKEAINELVTKTQQSQEGDNLNYKI